MNRHAAHATALCRQLEDAAAELVVHPYLSINEAADFVRLSTKRLRNLMANRTLREGVHYTRPRGLRPRFLRAALVAWIEDTEKLQEADDAAAEASIIPAAPRRSRCKVDLSLVPQLEAGDHGL